MTPTHGVIITILPRSSDGYICHPGHRSYHLLRLLAGSLMAGWTWALVLLTLGFLGNIEFSHSVRLSLTWIFVIGSILGIIGGAIISLIAGLLTGLVPPLRRNIHPLALVRAGFMLAVFSPLFSLLTRPAAPVMVWTGPVLAAILALSAGFTAVLLVGAASYAAAGAVLWQRREEDLIVSGVPEDARACMQT